MLQEFPPHGENTRKCLRHRDLGHRGVCALRSGHCALPAPYCGGKHGWQRQAESSELADGVQALTGAIGKPTPGAGPALAWACGSDAEHAYASVSMAPSPCDVIPGAGPALDLIGGGNPDSRDLQSS